MREMALVLSPASVVPHDIIRFLGEPQASKRLYIIFAGVAFHNEEGQTPVRLAQAFAKNGSKCLYVYFHYRGLLHPYQYGRVEQNIFVCSSARFLRMYQFLFRLLDRRKTGVIVTHPHPHILKPLLLAKQYGIGTSYHVLDCWSEFKKHDLAGWYRSQAERKIVQHVSWRFSVSRNLAAYYSQKYHEKFLVVPNGYIRYNSTPRKTPPIPRGTRTLGYVGWLCGQRLDWALVCATARRHPDWVFHMMGYGSDDGLSVPKNVHIGGLVTPDQYASLVSQFDVCLIPYRKRVLSAMSDPIKAYDYLSQHRPVVVTGVDRLAANPYTYTADTTVSSFSRAIVRASRARPPHADIDRFLRQKTWDHRARLMERAMQR